jgi:hypothetical protein
MGSNVYGIDEYNDVWTILTARQWDLDDAREADARRAALALVSAS